MIKVLNVMLGKKYGGLEEVFLKFAKNLENKKIQVYNITRHHSDCKKALYNLSINNFSVAGGGFFDFKTKKDIFKFAKEKEIDIIVAHGRRAIYHCIKANTGLKIVSFLHTPEGFGLSEIFKSDFIVVLNNEQKSRLLEKKYPKERIIKIPNCIENEYLKDFRPKIIKNNYFTIGMLCRLDKIKGIDVFLEGMSILQKKGYNFEIKIGGEGPEKANLIALGKKLNLKKISWLGFVDREYFFKDLNIFVNQSTHETFGLSTIEAMASGCFVVATKTAGSFEIITDKVDGFLSEINSPNSLVKIIEEIIFKNDIDIQINAFHKVRDNFSSDVVFNRIRETIADIYRPDR